MINEVSQCVESINGVKEGRWKATLTFYKPMFRGHSETLVSHSIICFFPLNLMCFQLYRAADQAVPAEYPRDFLGISLPEQPNRYYFIIRSQKIVLEADSSIQMIMEKLQSYKSRVSLTFEVCLPISPAQEVFEIWMCVCASVFLFRSVLIIVRIDFEYAGIEIELRSVQWRWYFIYVLAHALLLLLPFLF